MDGQKKVNWLNDFVLSASDKIETGQSIDLTILTKKHEYHLTSIASKGELATIYEGYFDENTQRKNVIVKVISESCNNDLAKNEIKTLKTLWKSENGNQIHLPRLIDNFKTDKGLIGIVLEKFEGFNLRFIRRHPLYQNGVPSYHAAWMLSRILTVVGYAHSLGIIHGNIEPDHILIKPHDHNLCLIDWSYASSEDSGFKAVNAEYSAPEVSAPQQVALSSSDLYSVGRCMVFLLGGNLENNSLPLNIDERFKRFIENFLIDSPLQRARDAWEMMHKLEELRTEIWGEHEFTVFNW